jgi:hypothetical protein
MKTQQILFRTYFQQGDDYVEISANFHVLRVRRRMKKKI